LPLISLSPSHAGNQEKELPLHMGGHFAPSLLVAVNGFDGCPEEMRHLLLRLVQLFAEI
jgi:hypothetical protein